MNLASSHLVSIHIFSPIVVAYIPDPFPFPAYYNDIPQAPRLLFIVFYCEVAIVTSVSISEEGVILILRGSESQLLNIYIHITNYYTYLYMN
jgi:hypothetical protein